MPEHYLGIDVGYSESRRTTGLCLITIDQTSLQWRCCNTGTEESEPWEDLRSLVPKGTSLAGVGIDGPLARNLKIVDRYRSADALLSRGRFQRRGKPGPTNSPTGRDLHTHATKLAKLVISLQTEAYLDIQSANHPDPIYEARILEVFPTSFLAVLLTDADHTAVADQYAHSKVPRGKKSDKFWEKAIEMRALHCLVQTLTGFKPEGLEAITDHDHRAGFICALAALCVARSQYVAAGDPEDGHIVLPPILQPWAEDSLRKNLGSVRRLGRYHNHDKAQVICNGIPWR